MDKCHITVKFNPQINNFKKDCEYFINFCEDYTIEKPRFIRNSVLEHTIQSRWITPCMISKSIDSIQNYYNAYYHPVAFDLARNQEFKRIIIENAIEDICNKDKLISELKYDILPTLQKYLNEVSSFSRPRFDISIFSSISSQQKFIELFIYLPFIISSNSIVIETSESNFYLQTEKPYKYELNLQWPDQVKSFNICFCNFLKKEKHLIIVLEFADSFSNKVDQDNSLIQCDSITDKENSLPSIECGIATESLANSNERNSHAMCEICNDNSNYLVKDLVATVAIQSIDECGSEPEQFIDENRINCRKNESTTNRRVRFNSTNSCIVFHETKPITDISEICVQNVPMKTNCGCSAKKYNYKIHKSQKNNREKSNKSARSKRNSLKKK